MKCCDEEVEHVDEDYEKEYIFKMIPNFTSFGDLFDSNFFFETAALKIYDYCAGLTY